MPTDSEDLDGQNSDQDVPPWHPWHNGYPIRHFYTRTFCERIRNRHFRVGVYSISFVIRNMDDAESPDALLRELLRHQILEAEYNCAYEPEKFSVIIRSNLLNKPIQIPYSDFEMNTPESIMNLFDDVEQSGKRPERNRPSLYSQPLHIEIIMGPDKDEVFEIINNRMNERSGSGAPRVVINNINRTALIEVPESEGVAKNLCLFMAVEMAREHAHSIGAGRKARDAFYRLVNRKTKFYQEKREKIVMELIDQIRTNLGININAELEKYALDTYVPIIQNYYDLKYPQKYRIIVFGQYGHYKPLWKGEKKAEHNLAIFLEYGHFIGIRLISAFFGVKNYCVDCECSFNRPKMHRAKCKALCLRCAGMGFAYPCPDISEYENKKCEECKIIFTNPNCYKRHLVERMCSRRRMCMDCGYIYQIEKGVEHKCFATFCRECNLKHSSEDGCYVQQINIKKQNAKRKPYLMVIYDFECTTHTPISSNVLRQEVFGNPGENATDISEQILLQQRKRKHTEIDASEREDVVKNQNSVIFEHRVNCISAYLTCSVCVRENRWSSQTTENCKVCGPGIPRMKTWIYGGLEKISDPLDTFLDWIIHELNGGAKRRLRTYAFAHYSGRYDMHLLVGAIYRKGGLSPRIIRAGNKLYELALPHRKAICPEIFFRDTFNWMSMRLADLPKALDLGPEIQDKLFFCHSYNRNENLDIELAQLPPAPEYFPETMGKKKRALFNKWYSENLNTPFTLREQLRLYCENDVNLLANAIIRFQSLFRALAPRCEFEDDVLANSLTIASACIRHFCINHLIPGQVAIVPDLGYHKRDIQSFKGLKYLRWFAHHHRVQVQHRDSGKEGEYRLHIPQTGETFRLDGYVRRQPEKADLCIEFNGCAWHGHGCVYEPQEICLNGKTSQANLDELRRRKMLIESQGIETHFLWECEVDEMLEGDPEMSEFFETVRDSSIIVPRDALFGGRTGPLSLKCDLDEIEGVAMGEDLKNNFELLYYDIVSLYPAMNFRTEYCIGHPKVKILDRPVNWTTPADHSYRGLLKVFIVPPRDLYLPIIPQRIRGKLIFALCNACALRGCQEEKEGNAARKINPFYTPAGILREPYSRDLGRRLCTHGENERGWVSVVTDIELNLSLRYGYRVTHVYNVYHWKEWSSELFRPYVRQFMQMKIQASGWPDEVLRPGDEEEERRLKMQYIERNREEYGIELKESEIVKNPGLRYISKICLNSMWGRWSLRNNLGKDLITDSPSELHTLLNDPKLEVGAVELLSEKLAAVPYKKKRDFVKSGNKHNVMLAIITTAAARAALYDYMDRVHRSPDCKLLYTDTDSIIFLKRRSAPIPFTIGSMLGQMSNEYPGRNIRCFYCAGCKQYCIEDEDAESGERGSVLKCRGCTLDGANEDVFNSSKFKNMVNNFGLCDPLIMERQRFRPDFRRGRIVTRTVQFTYRPIFDKAHIDAHLDVYPFGYCGDPVKFITTSVITDINSV